MIFFFNKSLYQFFFCGGGGGFGGGGGGCKKSLECSLDLYKQSQVTEKTMNTWLASDS